MNNITCTIIHFDYNGYYSKDDGNDKSFQWISREDAINTIVVKRSVEEITYSDLVEKICRKIVVDQNMTKLKLSYIPLLIEPKKPSYIFDDEDVFGYLMEVNKDQCRSLLHVELMKDVEETQNHESILREDRQVEVDERIDNVLADEERLSGGVGTRVVNDYGICDDEFSPMKKRTKTKKEASRTLPSTQQWTSNPTFPDDLLLSCFARISRLYYPTLSLVSKTFRSLLASPELYQSRSSLGRTETCLYVCLEFPSEPNPRWYTLCKKPHKTIPTKKKKEPSGYVLVQVPALQSPKSFWSSLVAVGSNIYNIGGCIDNKSSSSVSILDCRSHTWREGPSLKGKRMSPSASVIDGKIYVGGGCDNGGFRPHKSIEVFNSNTETWDLVPGPDDLGVNWSYLSRSACIDNKFCLMLGEKSLSYEPKEGKWDLVEGDWGEIWNRFSDCAIDNVLYCCNEGEIRWYNTKVGLWRKVMGLERLPKMSCYRPVKLADYGGKMVIVWDKYVPSSGYKNRMVWCAVITLERRKSREMWGKIEWSDAVLTVPKSYKLEYAIAATL